METELLLISALVSIASVVAAVVTRIRASKLTDRPKSLTIKVNGTELVLDEHSSAVDRKKAHKLLDQLAA